MKHFSLILESWNAGLLVFSYSFALAGLLKKTGFCKIEVFLHPLEFSSYLSVLNSLERYVFETEELIVEPWESFDSVASL